MWGSWWVWGPGQMTLMSPLPGGPGFPTQWAMESAKLLNSTWILRAYLLVFYCCHNKLLQTWQLKQYRFIILQLRKSEVQFGSGWAETEVLAGLHSSLETLGKAWTLPFTASEGGMCSLAPGSLPLSLEPPVTSLTPLPSSHLSFWSVRKGSLILRTCD